MMISKVSEKIRDLISNKDGLYTAALTFGRSVVLTSVAVTTLIVAARQLGILQVMELTAFDQLVRMRSDEGQDKRLLVVGITEDDIQSRQEDPVYDGTLAEVLAKIEQYQPRAIGIDILRDVPQGPDRGRTALAERLSKSDRIIAVCKVSTAQNPGNPPPPGIPEDRVGFADFPIDPDGILRRGLLVLIPTRPEVPVLKSHICNNSNTENQLLSLGFQLAMLYLKPQGIEPQQTSGDIKIGQTVFKRLVQNTGAYKGTDVGGYQFLINYRSSQEPIKQVSLTDVLAGKVKSDLVKDRVVLIGYTAPSKKDNFWTPYSNGQTDFKMSGVVIHAQVVSQILSAVLNDRPLIWYWSEWEEVLWIWGWSLLGGIIAWRLRKPLLLGLAGVAFIGVLFGTCYVLIIRAGWIPLVPPVLGLVITAGSVVLLERGGVKAIVKRMKLIIGIDQVKKEEEIAKLAQTIDLDNLRKQGEEMRKEREKRYLEDTKITPSIQPHSESQPPKEDYLQQWWNKAKQIRHPESNPHPEDEIVSNSETTDAMHSFPKSQPPAAIDYLAQMQQQARQFSDRDNELHTEGVSKSNHETPEVMRHNQESQPPAAIDYLGQIQQQARQVQNLHTEQITPSVSKLHSETIPALEASQEAQPRQEIDYLEQLQQQARQVKNRHSDAHKDRVSKAAPEELVYADETMSERESNTETTKAWAPPVHPELPLEMDYFYQLQQIAKELQDRETQSNT